MGSKVSGSDGHRSVRLGNNSGFLSGFPHSFRGGGFFLSGFFLSDCFFRRGGRGGLCSGRL